MTADVIQLADRRRKLADLTLDQAEELAIELAVSRGDRLAFVQQARGHLRSVLLALGQVQPDPDTAERHVVALMRLTAREEARASAAGWGPDDSPAIALRRAA